jgi:putative transposase
LAVTPGQAGDSPALPRLLAELRIPRLAAGRPRTRPQVLRADKAYSARGHRAHLRARGIKAVIPEPGDQIAHRKRRGSRGGRPVGYDVEDYKNRNVVERAFNQLKNWRGLATRYDKHALVYRGGLVLAAITLWLRA